MAYCSGCENRHPSSQCPYAGVVAAPYYEVSDWIRQAINEQEDDE